MTHTIITLSIDIEHKKFLDEKGLSPSAIMRDAINGIISEKDPELFQSKIDTFCKINRTKQSKWTKRIENESNYNKRKLIVFDFLEEIGVDTSEWEERKETERHLELEFMQA